MAVCIWHCNNIGSKPGQNHILKEIPHKARLFRFAQHLLTNFPSYHTEIPCITPVFLCRFLQSDENSVGTSTTQSLCGVA